MNPIFDTIVMTTPYDFKRVAINIPRMAELLPSEHIIFVGSSEVGELIKNGGYGSKVEFLDENSLIPFDDVNAVMKAVLGKDDVPRGVTGWYYQQFLKMKYAEVSKNRYYMTWDGDTVPTKPFSMFDENTGKPYFDLKYENHEEYFITIGKLFPGLGKVIGKSFISEHMIFDSLIMKEMIHAIESNAELAGKSFYEKILHAIRPGQLESNSFSEFETYGTYVAIKHQTEYRLKDWHSIRYGSIYFHPDKMTEEDYEWLGRDFDAVSFEKNQEYNPGIGAIFENPDYRSKLTARQIVEIIQESSSEGLNEVWE